LRVVVVGSMNDMKNGGMLGVDMECYAYYGVLLVLGGNTVGGGGLRVLN